MQYVKSAMKKSGKRSEKMIKTDKVIYRTRTQKEYDWIIEKLEEAGCKWIEGSLPTEEGNYWRRYFSRTCIELIDKTLGYGNFDFYKNESDYEDYEFIEASDIMHPYKDTAGKPKLSFVPPQIIFDIAEVREYGNKKYPDGGKDNWKKVNIDDYKDALLRHTLKYLQDPSGKDEESGIEHYKHMACNLAFICEMERE